jgi:hypothetical protein
MVFLFPGSIPEYRGVSMWFRGFTAIAETVSSLPLNGTVAAPLDLLATFIAPRL